VRELNARYLKLRKRLYISSSGEGVVSTTERHGISLAEHDMSVAFEFARKLATAEDLQET